MRNVEHRSLTLTLSRWLVGRYPQAWRERYETEMLSLLQDSAPRARDVLDLARGLASERARALFEPGDRPVLTLIFLFFGLAVLALALPLTASAAGSTAAFWLGGLPRAVGRAAGLLHATVVLVFVARLYHAYPSIQTAYRNGEPIRPLFSARAGLVWLVAMLASLALLTWASFSRVLSMQVALSASLLLHQLSGHSFRRVQAAVYRRVAARRQLRWALMELGRCKRLDAQGIPSPLYEAERSVDRLVREKDDAMAALHDMGYRASLAPPHTGDGETIETSRPH